MRHRNRAGREQIGLSLGQIRRLYKRQKTPRDRGKIIVPTALARFIEQAITRRTRYGQIKVEVAAHPIRSLHVFEHVFD